MLEPWMLSIVSALIGAAVGGAIGFYGSYLIQRGIWKRQTELEIIKTVYEPLFQRISSILNNVTNFKPLFSLQEFKEIKDNPLYWDVPEKIQYDLSQLAKHLKIYQKLYEIIKGPILRIIRETVEDHGLLKERADPIIDYRAFLDGSFVTSVSLYDSILKSEIPRELLKSEIKDLKNVEIRIVVSGFTAKEPRTVDEVCEKALAKAKKELILQQFKTQRDSLILRSNQIMDTIRSEIKKIKKNLNITSNVRAGKGILTLHRLGLKTKELTLSAQGLRAQKEYIISEKMIG